MVTDYQFNQMDEGEQVEVLWDSVYIGKGIENGYMIKYYRYNDFYIKSRIHPITNRSMALLAFKKNDILIPYLIR